MPERSLKAYAGVVERHSNEMIEAFGVGAGGDFRHHAAIDRVLLELRKHDVG